MTHQRRASTSTASTAGATTAQSKRRWTERDWDVAMEAQSFVAVFADASPAKEPAPAPPSRDKTTTKKRKTRKIRSSSTTDEPVAVAPKTTALPAQDDAFWLAQLQDDVTDDMLDTDASVRITWLNCVAHGAGDADSRLYTIAYDDRVEVQTILCHVYVVETVSGELELTAKSAARVAKSLRRTRGETTSEEDAEESEGETPPAASRRRKARRDNDDDDNDDDDGDASTRTRRRRSNVAGDGGRRVLRAKAPKKLSKREAAMHIPPHYASVDETKYEDRELLGTHAFDDCSGDLLSSNREIMRAVRTQNHALLKTLVEDVATRKKLYSFHANQSADVQRTALQYAIQADDVQAVKMLQNAHRVATSALGARPRASLPSHSTGAHTSAYSDYNRREINASRGGREGNNALLEDLRCDFEGAETNVLWTHPAASVKMLTVLHPNGEWVNDYANPTHVASVVRAGNLALAAKIVGVLGKNGGWGFNDLHVAVLSTSDQPVPTFRSSSVAKKAQQTKTTPLHFAAINPNVKYLEALWENGGSQQGNIRDDAQFEPIHYAAANESPSAVRFLLERKANLLSRTKAKHTPLMRALINRREETAIAILEHVAAEPEDLVNQVLTSRGTDSYQPIHFAAAHNCVSVLKHLLGMGVDVNTLAAGQITALSLAARLGHAECVAVLLAHGANVDRADKLKRTPLLLAVKNGHTRIAASLINHGANVNAYDSSENSVVHYAASYGWMSSLTLLFDAGADLWARNSWGFVPLICAMLKQRTVCADFILKSDSETQRFLDFRDRSGRTMLFLQCEHSSNLEQILFLLEKGLDPNISDCDGKRPLEVLLNRAARNDGESSFYLDAIRALVAHGATVNYKGDDDEHGNPTYPAQPLQLAIRHDAQEIFDFLLLEAGADPTIIETCGGTNAWLASASLGQQGAYYLEKLLDKYPVAPAVASDAYGRNIFHLIARNAGSSNLQPARLVERLLECYPNATELMHEKMSSDLTPLMALYEARSTFSANTHSEVAIAEQKQQDEEFSKIARLFAARITDVEALKQYVSIRQPIDGANPSTEQENMTTVRVLNSTILHTASSFRLATPPPYVLGTDVFGSSSVSSAPSTSGFSFGGLPHAPQPASGGFPHAPQPASGGFGGFGSCTGSGFGASPSSFGSTPAQFGSSPSAFGSTPSVFGSSPFGASPSPFGASSSGFGSSSSGFGTSSSGFGFGAVPSGLGSGRVRRQSRRSRSTYGSSFRGPGTGGFGFGSTVTSKSSSSATQEMTPPVWRGENVVELLLQTCELCKSLVNIPTRTDTQTPLLISVGNNDLAAARVLLAAGADPNYSAFRCDNCVEGGLTPCHECSSRGLTNTALLQVVARDQLAMMQLLLENGASADCVASGTLDTPLHLAMRTGSVAHTRLLLAHGASMTKLNAARSTPLATAISLGFSVDTTKPHEGEIQFSTAILGPNCKPPSVGAPPCATISPKPKAGPMKVMKEGGTVIDTALACPEAVAAIFLADENERTPLHHASTKRDLPLLRALLQPLDSTEKAAYVNKPDVFGRTALHVALNNVSMKPDASFDVERFLFLSGASATAVDNFGLSPLHFALRKINLDWHLGYDATLGLDTVKEQKETGEYEAKKAEAFTRHLNESSEETADPVETLSNLIAAGCDPLTVDGLGRSPLHLASSIGAFVCASTLLSSCSASRRLELLEQLDVDGFSPLWRAFEHGRETTITTLIQSGAKVSGSVTICGQERSYFSVAVEKLMSGICHMLLNAGFSRRQAVEDAVCGNQLQLAKNLMVGLEVSNDRSLLVAGNSHGETLLHCLARSCSGFNDLAAELAWTLVEDGLDVSALDDNGNTALHHAAAKGNTRFMDFLLHHGSDVNARNQAGLTPLMLALKETKVWNRTTTLHYMLLRDELDLRVCNDDGFDAVALFYKHCLTDFETDTELHFWFELALRRHGDLNRTYAAMVTEQWDLFNNEKLGSSINTEAPLLIWMSYAPSMSTRCQLLRALLQHGASPSATDSNGNSVLMHLVTRNLFVEASLVVQESSVTHGQLRALVDAKNYRGQTALHLAIEPLEYGSYENIKMSKLLVDNGASLEARNAEGATPLDCATRQSSRRVFRFLKAHYPTRVTISEEEAFDEAMDVEQWRDAPAFRSDAEKYLDACKAAGKIVTTRIAPRVNHHCDVGAVNSVYGLLGADGKVIEGEEYNALLTKVDVKHGKHGINVFYRTQVVHDELQNIFVVFTNWGRIGEEGKYQNTPFHSAVEAVTEFKKIFRSKTSNAWEDRHAFEKRVGKYNLVQRVNSASKLDEEVTRSFTEHMQCLKREQIDVRTDFAALTRGELDDNNLLDALFAITDVRNLQLAARDYQYGDELPLAREDVLRRAMVMLNEMREVVLEQADVRKEITVVSGNLASEDASDQLSELSDRLAAFTEDLSERSSRYYEIVPRNEDRHGSAIAAFDNVKAVDAELYRLKCLLEITQTYKMLLGAKLRQKEIHPMEYVVESLQIQFTRLPAETDEYAMLTKYFTNGIRPSERSRYRISNVFDVARRGEAQRLQSCLESNPAFAQQHTTLLWHGTSRTNVMGILSEGLRIAPPEAPHSGHAYGKGIYFSDVAAKSLNYCGYAYAIEKDVEERDGATTNTTTKSRQVQYMLLCEVALGNQRDVRMSFMYNCEELESDGFQSVRAVGQHVPNATESLVSPSCGVQVPLGRVGRPGHDFERPSAWAVKELTSTNYDSYSLQKWEFESEAFLDRTLASKSSWKAGDSVPITKTSDKALFVRKGYYSGGVKEDTKVEIRIADLGNGVGGWDVGVEFVVTPPSSTDDVTASPVVVAKARRHLNVSFKKLPKLDDGFSIPQLSGASQYNEHIVYTTEQARIRYLVEVELQ